MSSLPLPLECLHLIVAHLAQVGDVTTLARLLRVNRYVCNATLPFLYSNPFQADFHDLNKKVGRMPEDSRRKLAQVLLRQVPPEQCPDLLRMAVLDWPSVEDAVKEDASGHPLVCGNGDTPFIDYLTHIRHLDINEMSLFKPRARFEQQALPIPLQRCLGTFGLAEKYRSEDLCAKYNIFRAVNCVADNLKWDIKRQLLWALCHRQSIQQLTIPVSDRMRYLDTVSEFNALSNVTFLVDKHYAFSQRLRDKMAPEDRVKSDELEEEWASIQEDMVRFVQEHRSIHKNILMRASCHSYHCTCENIPHGCLDDTRRRILQALPPLQFLRRLDHRNWAQFVIKSEDTDLGFVETVIEPFDTSMAVSATKPFLRRCRTLKKLEVHSAAPETFQWAAREREQHDDNLHNGIIPEPLVPLESIRVSSYTHSKASIVNDASFAFNSTLKALSLSFSHRFPTDLDPIPDFNIGQGWILPKLQDLCIHMGGHALHVHPDLFSGSPGLEHIELNDFVVFPAPAGTRPWPSVELPFLKTLDLLGTPAMSFHPGTLYSTPSLKELTLNILSAAGDEPLDDMDATAAREALPISLHPGVWTWDWHLPKLTHLEIRGMFGLQFQFRMLHECPSLEILHLDNMNSVGNGPINSTRTLMLADLLDTEEHLQNKAVDPSGPAYPHIPKLRELIIMGWDFGQDVLRTLFHIVAPNIVNLNICDCTGFDLKGWMHAAEGLHQLSRAFLNLSTTVEDLNAVGLRPLVKEWIMTCDGALPLVSTLRPKFIFGNNTEYVRVES
ncbi:hypothetical protein BG011_004403 [Mortierella polycephala]|uniref:F-box domain-containing protein n=1 Tax=Mortierella polycephala TaxID=41804 RepID=A0A9P6QDS7_9FUNG|nr:hypothetical protein BG011_004403 [Mortierella polycephala]